MHLRSIKIIAKTLCLSTKPMKGIWTGSEYEFANIKVLKSLRRILDSEQLVTVRSDLMSKILKYWLRTILTL